MKKFVGAMVLGTLVGQASVALADDQKSVIFEDTYLERGYTAFGARSANVMGKSQAFAGVLGGWHFTDRLVFGVRADALVSHVDTDVVDAKRLGVTQIGVFTEYDVWSRDLITVSASLAGGSGDAGYKVVPEESSVTAATGTETQYRHDNFTFVEPEVTAQMHVSHRVDLGLSFGYRTVRGLDLEGVTSKGMQGGTAALMMRGNF